MKADEPEWVAKRIAQAILARRQTVSIGAMERIYAALNSLAPKLIDSGLASQVRKVRADFRNEQKRLIKESETAHKAVQKFHARVEKELPKQEAEIDKRIAILKGRLGL